MEVSITDLTDHLLELDHDEYDHGEDVEDHQETSTDSNGQVVPEVNSFQNTVDGAADTVFQFVACF